MLAIRSTHGLNVPLSDGAGTILVDKNYVEFAIGLANSKLALNAEKIRKLEKGCAAVLWLNDE